MLTKLIGHDKTSVEQATRQHPDDVNSKCYLNHLDNKFGLLGKGVIPAPQPIGWLVFRPERD
jgi:hypothetical protein